MSCYFEIQRYISCVYGVFECTNFTIPIGAHITRLISNSFLVYLIQIDHVQRSKIERFVNAWWLLLCHRRYNVHICNIDPERRAGQSQTTSTKRWISLNAIIIQIYRVIILRFKLRWILSTRWRSLSIREAYFADFRVLDMRAKNELGARRFAR